ncbi:MAG: nucleotidyltransferase substrate binding protein [Myxococcota bacterium]
MILDLTPLRAALGSLSAALEVVNDASWFPSQPERVRNTLVAGVIQNFEFVYEIGVKMLKRRLEAEAASPEEIDESSFRNVLRIAAEKGLIDDVDAWFRHRELRNITAHTYDRVKARRVLDGMAGFVADARALLLRLEARNVD